jgi:hypothetical protein
METSNGWSVKAEEPRRLDLSVPGALSAAIDPDHYA